MNQPSTTRRNPLPGLILAAAALALVAYFFWPKQSAVVPPAELPAAVQEAGAAVVDPSSGRPLPPGAVAWVGGIPVDAEGHRIVNEAGLPYSDEPLPVAKPIPVKAPAGTVIGYSKDAQGKVQPIRAGDLKQIPNTPGSFAVVDMWAEGGPTVVPPTEGVHISEAELAKRRAAEAARDRAGQQQP